MVTENNKKYDLRNLYISGWSFLLFSMQVVYKEEILPKVRIKDAGRASQEAIFKFENVNQFKGKRFFAT